MAFVTDCGLFCYRVISFGLKNTRITYQWLENKVIKGQIGHNMEVYVDDISLRAISENHIDDL